MTFSTSALIGGPVDYRPVFEDDTALIAFSFLPPFVKSVYALDSDVGLPSVVQVLN